MYSPYVDSGLRRNDGYEKEVQEISLLLGELGVSPRFCKVPQRMGD